MHHHWNPIAFHLFSDPISWYWLAYVFGFFFVYFMCIHLFKQGLGRVSPQELNAYAVCCWIGIIAGGRFGYVLIYHPSHYLKNPDDILAIWLGGMSFHGALMGCLLAAWIVSHKRKTSLYKITDLLCLLVPFPIALGRIANFLNGELAGRSTSLPWGVIFPAYDSTPRHPSQLYQAALEGILLFAILWLSRTKLKTPKTITAYFLIGYGVLRGAVEFVRLPDPQIGYLAYGIITTGHLLCALMIVAGSLILRSIPTQNFLESKP